MITQFYRSAGALALSLGLSSLAVAAPSFHASVDTMFSNDADIEGTNSSVQTTSVGFSLSNENFTLAYKNSNYDFSGGIDPFSSLHKLTFDMRHEDYFATNLKYYLGLTLGTLFEDDISLSDSYTLSPRAALGWTFMNGWTLYGGAYANLNAADNIFLPIVGLKIGEYSDLGWSGAIAYPETKVQYRFNKSLAADLTYLTVCDTYYISNSVDRHGKDTDGFYREEAQGASLGVTYSFSNTMHLSGGVFTYFDREFKFYDNSGNKVLTLDADDNAGAYARLSFSF